MKVERVADRKKELVVFIQLGVLFCKASGGAKTAT